MAGEWIKMECATPDKPEVLALTVRMGWDDPDLTVGKLFRLWRWFDQQTTDGNARGVTPALLDRQVGVTGFIQAVADVGWLTINDDGITLTNFDRHNGKTAKERGVTAKRVANHRANASGNGESNAATVTAPLAREEKRREEKKEPKGSVEKATRKCPDSFVVTDEMREWAASECLGVNIERETEKLRDHTFKTARTNWAGVWRNWMREASDRLQGRGAVPVARSFAASDREAGMQRWEQMTGRTHPDRAPAGHVIDADVPAPLRIKE